MVLTDDRVGSIDGEEDGALTGEMRTAPDVAGFAADIFTADIMLDEERFDGTDENDGARCATARHGKPASKTTNGKNRPQKRNMVPPPNELQTR